MTCRSSLFTCCCSACRSVCTTSRAGPCLVRCYLPPLCCFSQLSPFCSWALRWLLFPRFRNAPLKHFFSSKALHVLRCRFAHCSLYGAHGARLLCFAFACAGLLPVVLTSYGQSLFPPVLGLLPRLPAIAVLRRRYVLANSSLSAARLVNRLSPTCILALS